MTEQKFKVGDEVWEYELFPEPNIAFVGLVNELREDDGWLILSFSADYFFCNPTEHFPTREAAKAALIEKLEQALKEAREL